MKDTIDLGKFQKGINNIAKETDLPEGFLKSALNVDIDNAGNLLRRRGYINIYSGLGIHSLYKGYFIEGTLLKKLISRAGNTVSVRDLGSSNSLSYCELNDEIYFTNQKENGLLSGAEFWPINPPQPSISFGSGSLSAGTYKVALRAMDISGRVSGSCEVYYITLSDNSSVAISGIVHTSDSMEIFISKCDGVELYSQGIIANTTTNLSFGSVNEGGRLLDTEFSVNLPAGEIIRYHKGRIYIASGKVLWHSEAKYLGLHNPEEDFLQFPHDITMIEPTDNGMFISTDQTYFVNGKNPKEFVLSEPVCTKAVKGTSVMVRGESLNLDGVRGDVLYWYTSQGGVIGFQDGQVTHLTNDSFTPEEFNEGVSFYREKDGIQQILTSLTNRGNGDGFAAREYVTAQVVRNGIVIT